MEGARGGIEDTVLDASNLGQYLLRLEHVRDEIIGEVITRTDAARRETGALRK